MITSYEARCEYGPDRYVFHGNIHETDFLNLDVVVSYSVLVQVKLQCSNGSNVLE